MLFILSHAKRWGNPYCPQTRHHQHFTLSSQLTLTSGHQVLLSPPRQLLASRAIGGCSSVSDDHAPRSLAVFQSWRVAGPQDASKARNFVSSLSSSARSYLDTCKQRVLRPVSEAADMETRLGPAQPASPRGFFVIW